MIAQGEVHWVDFGKPKGSEPAYRRPCVIVQNDAFNTSAIATVIVVVITGNLSTQLAREYLSGPPPGPAGDHAVVTITERDIEIGWTAVFETGYFFRGVEQLTER